MKIQLFLILALLCAMVHSAWAQSWEEVYAMTQTSSSDWTQLNEGSTKGTTLGTEGETKYYYAGGNPSFTNSTVGGSGLTIKGSVYIYIPAGSTLTCKGANASGATGAGAGIELASGNTLFLIGGGTINAIGGNAANGGAGGNGGAGSFLEDKWIRGGDGGDGGNGGGGAGAGIGTRGGAGGNGGSGAKATQNTNFKSYKGNTASAGTNGATSVAMGKIYVYQTTGVTVNATGGAAGANGTRGSKGLNALDDEGTAQDVYSIAGGAGGGAGGFGGAASNIGTGGSGGGGGGGGASGGIGDCASHNFYRSGAYGGQGGQNSDGSYAPDGETNIMGSLSSNLGQSNVSSGNLSGYDDKGWESGNANTWCGSGGSRGFRGNATTNGSTVNLILWPTQGAGTAESPYLMNNADEWNTFIANVSIGTSYSGKVIKLAKDISVTTMAGTSETNSFQGTFDGDGHTLTFNKSDFTEIYCAPFRYVGNASFRNLHTAGTINTTYQYSGGMVAWIVNGSTVSIENCRSSMTINSSHNTNGGFVSRLGDNSTLTISGSVFDGSFEGTGRANGGFVGYCQEGSSATIVNCLFKPDHLSSDLTGCQTFSRGVDATITNCYYTQPYGVAQGTAGYFGTATVPSSLGDLVTDYGIVTAYANGLLFNGKYYAAPSSGAGSENSPYIIDSEAALAMLAHNVNSGVSDYFHKHFSLICDLDLSGQNWTPIGTTDRPFKGNFNGNNHIISNITVNNPSGDYNGLFGWVEGSIYHPLESDDVPGSDYIKNFVVKNANIRGRDYTSGVAGRVHGALVFENVILDGATVHGANFTSGFIGSAEGDYQQELYISNFSELHVNNCLFINGSVTENTGHERYDYVPNARTSFVMFGNIQRYARFKNCYFNNVVYNSAAASEDYYNLKGYPITTDVPSNVSCSNYNTTGIWYNDNIYVHTAHFQLTYKNLSQLITSVKVNNIEVGTTTGTYDYTNNDSEAQRYAVTVEAAASGSTGSGDSSDDPITIPSTEVWDALATDVINGNGFGGKYFMLSNDITVTNMVGSSKKQGVSNGIRFHGTFDGNGHTLTFNKGTASEPFAEDYCAPFRHIEDATIRNLRVAGDIYTSKRYAAGLVGFAAAASSNTISNCVSSVAIHSTYEGNASHGGFIGYVWTYCRTAIQNCVFDGKLLGPSTSGVGGFIGTVEHNSEYQPSHINTCLFVPAEVNVGNGGCFFGSADLGFSLQIYNCYYTETMLTAQGTRIFAFDQAPAFLGELVESFDQITIYTNGILYNGKYYVVPVAISLANTGTNDVASIEGYAANVTLTNRTLFKDCAWNTLCLPFNVKLAGSPLAGATVRPLTEASINGTTLNLTFGDTVDELVAGTPYILRFDSSDQNPLMNPSSALIESLDFISEVPTCDGGEPTNWHYGEDPVKLVDGNTHTKYGLSSEYLQPWVEFHYASAITPKGYALWTAEDTNGARNPRSWTIKARNSGDAGWTTLVTVSNLDGNKLPRANNQCSVFALNNSKAYQYFRFEARKDVPEFQLAELQFCTVQPKISSANITNPVFRNVIIDATDRSYDNGLSGNAQVRFLGTYESKEFDATDRSILLMGGDNMLYYPTTGAGLGAQRAYIKIGNDGGNPAQVKAFNVDFGDGENVTGIIEVHGSEFMVNGSDGWYTLDGRKVSNGQQPKAKGLYINNGKKILIK